MINRRYYEVIVNTDIKTIDLETLQEVFGFNAEAHTTYTGSTTPQPQKVADTIAILEHNKIQRTHTTLFKCPFHPMHGKGNLNVLPDGKIHCFHEQKTWYDVHSFIDQLNLWRTK